MIYWHSALNQYFCYFSSFSFTWHCWRIFFMRSLALFSTLCMSIADEHFALWKIFEHTELFCMRHNRKLITHHISQHLATWPHTSHFTYPFGQWTSWRYTLYIIVKCTFIIWYMLCIHWIFSVILNILFYVSCIWYMNLYQIVWCLLFLRSVDVISYTTGLYSLDSWFCCICFANVFLVLDALFIFVLLNK
jgi:hypothetical protein